MKQLFVMRVLRIDGQIIGTGWTGQKIDADLLYDSTRLVKKLRSIKALTGRGRVSLTEIDGEVCLLKSGEVDLVFRTN